MRKVVPAILTTALFFIATSCSVAQEFGVDLAFMDKYIWRGAVLDEGSVVQPSLTGNMGDLSVNLWGNMNLTDKSRSSNQMNEWDYTVDYSKSLDAIGISAGIIGYTFPNSGGPGTTELYVGASYETFASPAIKFHHDIEMVDGSYVSLSLAHSQPVLQLTSLDIGASVGFGSASMNRALYGAGESTAGFSDFQAILSMPFGLSETLDVTPSLQLNSILDSHGRTSYSERGQKRSHVTFGLTASASL